MARGWPAWVRRALLLAAAFWLAGATQAGVMTRAALQQRFPAPLVIGERGQGRVPRRARALAARAGVPGAFALARQRKVDVLWVDRAGGWRATPGLRLAA